MSGHPNKRRRTTAIGPDSSIFAKATTHKTITTMNCSGMVVQKDILVPLLPVKEHIHEKQHPPMTLPLHLKSLMKTMTEISMGISMVIWKMDTVIVINLKSVMVHHFFKYYKDPKNY